MVALSIKDGAIAREGELAEDAWIVVPLVLVEAIDHCHLLGCQVEVVDRHVFDDTFNLA